MLSRRTVIMAGLAASAGFHSIARAQNPPGGGADSLLTQATKIVMPSAFSPMQ